MRSPHHQPGDEHGEDDVDVKIWVQLPDSSLLSLLNLPMVTIGANADFDAALLNYTLTGGEPLGNYKIGGRFLSWISGDILCEDIVPFVVR